MSELSRDYRRRIMFLFGKVCFAFIWSCEQIIDIAVLLCLSHYVYLLLVIISNHHKKYSYICTNISFCSIDTNMHHIMKRRTLSIS